MPWGNIVLSDRLWLLSVLSASILSSQTLVFAKDISGCCTRILISSEGDAIEHQSNRVGEYTLSGVVADRPMYKHVDREEYLFYLMSRNKGLWMVGPKVNQFNGGLAHRGDTICVEDVQPGEWKFTDGKAWHVDPSLNLTCVDRKVGSVECTYRDGVQFVGGDLPDEFGGGGIVTSSQSSAECIQECENRDGCQYWSWVESDGPNCFLKFDKVRSVRVPKYVSGSIPSACISGPPADDSDLENSCAYPDIQFIGGDLNSLAADSLESCRTLCAEDADCKVFTYYPEEERNCFLKSGTAQAKVSPGAVSGSVADDCKNVILPQIDFTFDKNEINGKFKMDMTFREEYRDPNSVEYQKLSGDVEKYLRDMLDTEPGFAEQAVFDVRVVSFTPGSVVCNFKVNYVLREAYLAIPFAIKPTNITTAMNKNFKFRKGIIFQKFIIVAGSFKASAPVDHCAAKGCSHKCDYDYSVEEYLCTCPPGLELDVDDKTCVDPNRETTTYIPEITVTLLPSDCLWASWSDWSSCNCESGQSERKRTIQTEAKNGGICSGRYKEVKDCSCDESIDTPTTRDPTEFGDKISDDSTEPSVSTTVSDIINGEEEPVTENNMQEGTEIPIESISEKADDENKLEESSGDDEEYSDPSFATEKTDKPDEKESTTDSSITTTDEAPESDAVTEDIGSMEQATEIADDDIDSESNETGDESSSDIPETTIDPLEQDEEALPKQMDVETNGTSDETTTSSSETENDTEAPTTSFSEVMSENNDTDSNEDSTDVPSDSSDKVEDTTVTENPIYDDDTDDYFISTTIDTLVNNDDMEKDMLNEDVAMSGESTEETTTSAETNEIEVVTEPVDMANIPDETTVPSTSDRIKTLPEDGTDIIDPTMITDTPRSFPDPPNVDTGSTTVGYEDPSGNTDTEEQSTESSTNLPSETSNDSTEISTGSPTEQPTDQPTQQSTEQPYDLLTDPSTVLPEDSSTEASPELSTVMPNDLSTDLSADPSAESVSDSQTDLTTELPEQVSTDSTDELPEGPSTDSTNDLLEKPSTDSTNDNETLPRTSSDEQGSNDTTQKPGEGMTEEPFVTELPKLDENSSSSDTDIDTQDDVETGTTDFPVTDETMLDENSTTELTNNDDNSTNDSEIPKEEPVTTNTPSGIATEETTVQAMVDIDATEFSLGTTEDAKIYDDDIGNDKIFDDNIDTQSTTTSPVSTTLPTTIDSNEEMTTQGEVEDNGNSDDTTTNASAEETSNEFPDLTTTAPGAMVKIMTGVEDVTTTMMTTTDDTDISDATTEIPMEVGEHEFDCEELADGELNTTSDQIPMKCTKMDGSKRRVFLVISKSQVDPEALFSKNVKVVVKDLMVMSITPESNSR